MTLNNSRTKISFDLSLQAPQGNYYGNRNRNGMQHSNLNIKIMTPDERHPFAAKMLDLIELSSSPVTFREPQKYEKYTTMNEPYSL